MEMSQKVMERLINMPIIESTVFKSKDGKFIVHKTTITDIKPTAYYEAVMEKSNE